MFLPFLSSAMGAQSKIMVYKFRTILNAENDDIN